MKLAQLGAIAGAFLLAACTHTPKTDQTATTTLCELSNPNRPSSCDFDTDQCGFLYVAILNNGKTLDPNFTYPASSLACALDPSDDFLFTDAYLAPSEDPSCEGWSEAECVFYHR